MLKKTLKIDRCANKQSVKFERAAKKKKKKEKQWFSIHQFSVCGDLGENDYNENI